MKLYFSGWLYYYKVLPGEQHPYNLRIWSMPGNYEEAEHKFRKKLSELLFLYVRFNFGRGLAQLLLNLRVYFFFDRKPFICWVDLNCVRTISVSDLYGGRILFLRGQKLVHAMAIVL